MLRNDFVNYDDGDYVYQNPNITPGLTVKGIGWAFSHTHAINWHPLTSISHMLDCQLYGLQPWGHHLTSLLLHAAAAILLFLAWRRLAPNAFWPSAFVAAIFAIHPLRVESVAWISERKDVLSGVFFMLTLLAYAAYARSERRSAGKYLTVLVLFALGLLCKPTLVTLPFVLVLLDYWPLGRFASGSWPVARSLLVEKIPLFVLSAASCVITVFAQKKAFDTDLSLSVAQRIGNALVSYVTYIGQMIYPARLSVFYPYGQLRIPFVILGAVFLLTISAVFFVYRRKYPFLLVGWLWYLGVLVPMIGVVQVGLQPRADRYTYLSQIGLYLGIVWGVATIMAQWRWRRAAVAIMGVFTVATLTLTSRAQTAYWRNSQVLWEHALEITSGNYIAHDNLGTFFLKQKRPEAALAEFQKAIQIKPDFEDAYVSGGSALMLLGQVDQAIGYYKKALELRPNSAEDWSNLATAQLKKGEIADAIEDNRKAVALKPDSAELQFNLGLSLANNLQWAEAMNYYQAAIHLQPDEPKFHNNLGVALINLGRADESLAELNEALRVRPNYPEAHYNLGCVLVSLGRKEEAAAQFAAALRLRPGYIEAKQQLQQLGVAESP